MARTANTEPCVNLYKRDLGDRLILATSGSASVSEVEVIVTGDIGLYELVGECWGKGPYVWVPRCTDPGWTSVSVGDSDRDEGEGMISTRRNPCGFVEWGGAGITVRGGWGIGDECGIQCVGCICIVWTHSLQMQWVFVRAIEQSQAEY